MSITRSRTRLGFFFEFACLSQIFALPSRDALLRADELVG
jgi:hypothetical protein